MGPRDGMGPHGQRGTGYGPGQRGTMMGPHYRQTPGQSTTSLESWMSDVDNYTDIVDRTGRTQVAVAVGATGNGGNFAYDPPVIRVSPGTTVRWEWTGQGGTHDVAFVDGSRSSRLTATAGASFERRFGRIGTYLYYCTPHRTLGMKGAVVVE
ncbi:halocyanin domain-containing protein [Halogranum amylolyticum]|nr:halocyanin domain-containing protein [Halogranum amylolyticum]